MVNGDFVAGWLYQDQLNPVAEVDSFGNIITRFVYGSHAHVPDYLIRDSVLYRYVADHLGSVRFLVNLTTGAIVQELDYDEFGKVLKNTNESFQPFTYAGGSYDIQTGLIRFGARDYYAEIGRWTAKDPIGFLNGDFNYYTFAYNDPINYLDILGTQRISPETLKSFLEQIYDLYQAKEFTSKYKKELQEQRDFWKKLYENPPPMNKNDFDFLKQKYDNILLFQKIAGPQFQLAVIPGVLEELRDMINFMKKYNEEEENDENKECKNE